MSDGYNMLTTCLERICTGPWKFIQLRGEPLSAGVIDGGDVDLLGTRESVFALLDAVYGWVQQGDCHARIVARDSTKYKLYLFSADGQHQVDFDLWVELKQLFGRTQVLLPEAALARAVPQCASLFRLPLALEVSVYVHHLISKRRLNVFTAGMRERLENYAQTCREGVLEPLLNEALRQKQITSALIQFADETLKSAPELYKPSHSDFVMRWKCWRLAPPRQVTWLSLMGGDGCGKTSMAKALQQRRGANSTTIYTGKHLYRKNIFFKLLVIFIRPLLFQDRERFDETLAPLVYGLASIRLRVGLWCASARKLVLMDRSLVDFLMCNRKSDEPSFGRKEWLTRLWGCRIPTVHFFVSYERLAERKQEMTVAGIAKYNQKMFQHFTRRIPTDYVLFNNDGTLEQSADSLVKLLRRSYQET
jgi:thymidylate kinase